MSDELTTDTLVAGENVQPVDTDTEATTPEVQQKSESVDTDAPAVEMRDGKMFVNGTRVYTRDDVNRIGATAKKDAESRILGELEVDSFDKVKSVVSQLRDTPEGESLNVQSLKDAVKKREQTVEELRAELHNVKTEYSLREHISTLRDNMPSAWNPDQKSAVVDLMKARDMLQLEGDSFAIRNGEDFITTDGETPDYASAVKIVGRSLGLPFAKKGVNTFDADKAPSETASKKGIDEQKVKTDPAYRNAYVSLRSTGRVARGEITDAMIKQQMDRSKMGDTSSRLLR